MKQNVQLKINGEFIDIDENTALGMTIVGLTTETLGQISLNYTNTFSVPMTNKNCRILGFLDELNMNTFVVQTGWYDKYDISVYIDGMFAFQGKTYISDYNEDRLNLFIISNKNVMDVLSKVTMWDATEEIIEELNSELDDRFSSGATFENIIGYLSTGENLAWLPYSVGTLNKQYPYNKYDAETMSYSCRNKYDDTDADDNRERYNLNSEKVLTTEFITNDDVVGDYKTGCIYVKLWNLLGVVLNNRGYSISIDQNVYQTLSRQYIRMPDIVTHMGLTTYFYSFLADDHSHYRIGDGGLASSKDVMFIDLIKYLCQEYCLVFDVDETNTINFHSINNVMSAETYELSINSIKSRNLFLEGVPQESYIGYKQLADDTTTTGAKQIISNNKNIEQGSMNESLMQINRLLPGYFVYLYDNGTIQTNTYALNMIDTNNNKQFVIVQRQATATPYRVKIQRYFLGQEESVYAYLYRAINRTVDEMGYWDTFANLCLYPDRIVVDGRISPYDMMVIKPWKRYRFRTIPGEWLIERISGYNPRIDNNSVEIIAIRLR